MDVRDDIVFRPSILSRVFYTMGAVVLGYGAFGALWRTVVVVFISPAHRVSAVVLTLIYLALVLLAATAIGFVLTQRIVMSARGVEAAKWSLLGWRRTFIPWGSVETVLTKAGWPTRIMSQDSAIVMPTLALRPSLDEAVDMIRDHVPAEAMKDQQASRRG